MGYEFEWCTLFSAWVGGHGQAHITWVEARVGSKFKQRFIQGSIGLPLPNSLIFWDVLSGLFMLPTHL